jgi:hypothetical protein
MVKYLVKVRRQAVNTVRVRYDTKLEERAMYVLATISSSHTPINVAMFTVTFRNDA